MKCTTCDGEGREKCPECNGNPVSQSCNECGGLGTIDVDLYDDDGDIAGLEEEECEECDGWGHYCAECDDVGSIECDDCDGSGEWPDDD